MSSMASSSGSYRGARTPRRGRGRGGRAPFFAKAREQIKPDLEKHPLGDLVKKFDCSDLSLGPVAQAEISDCQYIASYNWLHNEVPTILIPGKPPQWTPLRTPQRLREDRGDFFRDLNSAKYPNYPMAPGVHAIVETEPEFDTASIDLFACGSTLGNLLRFSRGIDRAFRFNIEVIGETVFFIRKENDPKEVLKDVRGFGHTFPEAYTTWETSVRGSETHQRIIRYEFGGLNCLVRFESDGYIRDVAAINDTVSAKTAATEDDLLQELQGATISQPTKIRTGETDAVKIKHGGSVVPQHSIFDLKTRSGRHQREIDMSDIHPTLWIKQIPTFIVAYHDGAGLFEEIRVDDLKNEVQAWARDNRDGIRRFATLLGNIVDIARNNPSKLLEVYCPGVDRLEVRKQYGNGVHALPADLVDRWENINVDDASSQGGSLNGSKDVGDDTSPDDRYSLDSDSDDSAFEPDYTACSANDCGYCGRCSY